MATYEQYKSGYNSAYSMPDRNLTQDFAPPMGDYVAVRVSADTTAIFTGDLEWKSEESVISYDGSVFLFNTTLNTSEYLREDVGTIEIDSFSALYSNISSDFRAVTPNRTLSGILLFEGVLCAVLIISAIFGGVKSCVRYIYSQNVE